MDPAAIAFIHLRKFERLCRLWHGIKNELPKKRDRELEGITFWFC